MGVECDLVFTRPYAGNYMEFMLSGQVNSSCYWMIFVIFGAHSIDGKIFCRE